MQPTDTPILEWKAAENLHHERTRLWYVVAIAFVLLCVTYSIFTSAWTFTVLTLALSALYFYFHKQNPAPKQIQLWQEGFSLDGNYTDWSDCDGFWMLKGTHYHELHIEKTRGSDCKILLGDQDPYVVHQLLSAFLPEIAGRHEKVLDTIIRICKL